MLMREFRHGVREVSRAPRFAVTYVIVLSAAASIVALASAVVDSMLLEPLPFVDARSTYQIVREQAAGDALFETTRVPANVIGAWSELNGVEVAAVQDGRKETVFYYAGHRGAVRIVGAAVSTNYFQLLGALPWRGRTFSDADVDQSSIILSHRTSVRLFGDADSSIGSPVLLNGVPYTVIGVMPASFLVPPPPGHPEPDVRVEAWVPIKSHVTADADHVLVRSSADPSAASLGGRLLAAGEGREDVSTLRIRPISLREVLVGPSRSWVRGVVLVASISFAFGMFTALGLVFVRRAGMARQLALHHYFGASGARLIIRSGAGTTVLSFLGAICGLLLAAWFLDVLRNAGPSGLARLDVVQIDNTTVWFTVCAAASLGLISGVLPATMLMRHFRISSALLSRAIGVVPALQQFRSRVVIVQFGLACALGVGALMLAQSVGALHDRLPVGDAASILVVHLPRPAMSDARENSAFYTAASREVAALPAVRAVGLTSSIPLRARDYYGRRWFTRIVDAGYFSALGIEFAAGRAFSSENSEAGAVAVINETLARQEFGDADPLGRTLDDRVVVGIVRDHAHRGLDETISGAMYVPVSQSSENRLSMLIATSAENAGALVAPVARVIASLDPHQPVEDIATLAAIAHRSPALSYRAFQRLSLLGLTLLAAALALLSLGSVLAQYLADHRREIALRLALGGPPGLQRRIVLDKTVRMLTTSLAVGLPLGFLLAHVIRTSLFAVSPARPGPYIVMIALFALIAGVAAMFTPITKEERLFELLHAD